MFKTVHRESRVVAVSTEQMFDLVADVESYPEFLPLMREARIVSRHASGYETEQVLMLGLLAYRFRTHTELEPPHAIAVTSADRNFRRFEIRWSLAPATEGGAALIFARLRGSLALVQTTGRCIGDADGVDHRQRLRGGHAGWRPDKPCRSSALERDDHLLIQAAEKSPS